jgi:hypothetical protein
MPRRICTFLPLLFVIASTSFAQNTSALINEALDKQVKLDLNTVLPQAMESIANQTGVRLEAHPAVWDLLPWGEQTNITAKIENQTLRQALEAITRKLGLTFVLKDEAVEIRPVPALMRLGRRSTVQELQALDLLASNNVNLSGDRPTVKDLLAAVDQRLVELKSPFAMENRAGDSARPDQVVFVPRNATLSEALESLTKDTGATWYPWGKSIVVVSKEDQVRNQLARTLTTRYNGVDVGQVLIELSQRSGVNFSIEPGAIQRIPPEFRTVRLVLDNASIQQALENIAGFTGLGYIVNDKGVYVWNQSATPGGGGTRDRMFGIIQLDNGMQVFVPQSQVPGDLKEYLKARTNRSFDQIRQMMKDEGFKPTSQPTTKPADQDL